LTLRGKKRKQPFLEISLPFPERLLKAEPDNSLFFRRFLDFYLKLKRERYIDVWASSSKRFEQFLKTKVVCIYEKR